jgi:aryl-alcohol dehydrogenase-like predicted oxidoreductase
MSFATARNVTEIACVQNGYNLADRSDQRLFDFCAADGVPYVPFFPLGSAFAIENTVLTAPAVVTSATRLGITPAAPPSRPAHTSSSRRAQGGKQR